MTQTSTSGVQELIERLRQEGVRSGRDEASRLVADARVEAARIVQEAKGEAARILEEGREALRLEKAATEAALQTAARDTVLRLRGDLASRIKRRLEEIAKVALAQPDFVKQVILEVAGKEVPKDRPITILVDPERSAVLDQWLNNEVMNLVREGVSLARVRGGEGVVITIDGTDIAVEITPEAITELTWQHLAPRFRNSLKSLEK